VRDVVFKHNRGNRWERKCVLSALPSRAALVNVELLATMLKELHGPLVLFGRRARIERSKVLSLSGFGIFLARVEPILS
jgi:hypothetical protein